MNPHTTLEDSTFLGINYSVKIDDTGPLPSICAGSSIFRFIMVHLSPFFKGPCIPIHLTGMIVHYWCRQPAVSAMTCFYLNNTAEVKGQNPSTIENNKCVQSGQKP